MHPKRVCKTARLLSHVRRIKVVEYRQNHLAAFTLALDDLDKLVQAPSRACVVPGEHDDGDPGRLDGLEQLRRDLAPFVEIDVVFESGDAGVLQGAVQLPRDVVPGILASEAQEHVVPAPRRCGQEGK